MARRKRSRKAMSDAADRFRKKQSGDDLPAHEPEPEPDAPLSNTMSSALGLPSEIECPNCAEVIKARAKSCRFCGEEIASPKQKRKRRREGGLATGRHASTQAKSAAPKVVGAVVVAVVLVVGGWFLLKPRGMTVSALVAPRVDMTGKWQMPGTSWPQPWVITGSAIRKPQKKSMNSKWTTAGWKYRWLNDTTIWVDFPDGEGRRVSVQIEPNGHLLLGRIELEPWKGRR